MRPVDKGNPLRQYTDYGDARHDLASILGYYCSYCEMKVYNSIEVEHVLPRNQGGVVVDWDNFLLSCKYCNTIKSDHNETLEDYFWPDKDNTDLAFSYSQNNEVSPAESLNNGLKEICRNTIALTGIDRIPGGNNEPTMADTRWRSREESWKVAMFSYNKWQEAPIEQLADVIAKTALSQGNYSIWVEVFDDVEIVVNKIDEVYKRKGLYKVFDGSGKRVVRTNGKI